MGLIIFTAVVAAVIVTIAHFGIRADRKHSAYESGTYGDIFYPENYKTTGFGSADLATYRSLYLAGVRRKAYDVGLAGYDSFLRFRRFFQVGDQEAIDTYETGYQEGRAKFNALRNTLTATK